jgi:hypothetical protein
MKLTLSIEGEPAAIESILAQMLMHLRGGQPVNFSTSVQPESGMGVEGIIEFKSEESELARWQDCLGWLEEARGLNLEEEPLKDWLVARLKAQDWPREVCVPIYAQLLAMLLDGVR